MSSSLPVTAYVVSRVADWGIGMSPCESNRSLARTMDGRIHMRRGIDASCHFRDYNATVIWICNALQHNSNQRRWLSICGLMGPKVKWF